MILNVKNLMIFYYKSILSLQVMKYMIIKTLKEAFLLNKFIYILYYKIQLIIEIQ